MVRALFKSDWSEKTLRQLTGTHEDFNKKENVYIDHSNHFLGCRNYWLLVLLNFYFHSVEYRHENHDKSGTQVECNRIICVAWWNEIYNLLEIHSDIMSKAANVKALIDGQQSCSIPNLSEIASIKRPQNTGTIIILSDPAIFCWPKSAPYFLEIESPVASKSLMNAIWSNIFIQSY